MTDKWDVKARVARGAALLDVRMPGWPLNVNTSTLAIHSCVRCVIAQLCGGDYDAGREALGLSPIAAGGYGFVCVPISPDISEYDALTAEWKAVIDDRLQRMADDVASEHRAGAERALDAVLV